jgi:hypothetical protein
MRTDLYNRRPADIMELKYNVIQNIKDLSSELHINQYNRKKENNENNENRLYNRRPADIMEHKYNVIQELKVLFNKL